MPGEAAGLSRWLGQPGLNQQQPPAGQASTKVGVIPHSQPRDRASEWHDSSEPLAPPSQTFCSSNATFSPAVLTFSCLPSIKHLFYRVAQKKPLLLLLLLPHVATTHLKQQLPAPAPPGYPLAQTPFITHPALSQPPSLPGSSTPGSTSLKRQPMQPGQCCGGLSWP